MAEGDERIRLRASSVIVISDQLDIPTTPRTALILLIIICDRDAAVSSVYRDFDGVPVEGPVA